MTKRNKNPNPEQMDIGLHSNSVPSGPVECLGMTFPSDAERRKYFLEKLAKKLKDPEFRKIEGFPIGEDEDILALSDPPYYTACPNPWLADFIKQYGTPYNPKEKYHREPFTADVSEGKNHPIYNAHSYHTKVPHRAIMRYMLHYTEPGELVFDGFAGTGMTGLAAQLCGNRPEVLELGYQVQDDGTILDEKGKPFSKLGARRAILTELSPAATAIAYNYNTPIDIDTFEREAKRILKEVEDELMWMYETNHTDGRSKGIINFVVWSEVNNCSECGDSFVFSDEARDSDTNKLRDEFKCPHCSAVLKKGRLGVIYENVFDARLNKIVKAPKRVPVLINYTVGNKKWEKKPDSNDLVVIEKTRKLQIPAEVPSTELPEMQMMRVGRMKGSAVTHIHHFFLPRPAQVIGLLWRKANQVKSIATKALLKFWLDSHLVNLSIRNRYRPEVSFPYNPLTGVFYVPSMVSEPCVFPAYSNKLKRVVAAFAGMTVTTRNILQTCSASAVLLPACSQDYIFTDPPFGENIYYSDLNFFVESWYRVFTNTKPEAIVDRVREKGLSDYQRLMQECFREYYRILKPGRWMTVEFSNSQASVWNTIQTTLQEVGFVVANVAALDKQQRSFQSVTSPTAVKQDLVISAYKPNGGLEDRFTKCGKTEEGVWDFIRTHLRNLPVVKPKGGLLEPIVERDPRILFDRTIAFYVRHGLPVPISSPEFQAGLADKFPERDGMYFLSEQAAEYDNVRMKMEGIGQLTLFVQDERSASAWLRNYLKNKPSKYQDIQPEFFEQLNVGWKKWETRPELRAMLDQYFLCYSGEGDVPPQIHSYLSTNFKELRNLPANHAMLRAKARDRWFVPDPRKNADVEQLREKRLLEEFWAYMPPGYESAGRRKKMQTVLPGMEQMAPKIVKGKRITIVRTEAIRVGFNFCFAQNDYQTIIAVARYIPESVIQNDEQLQMIYDSAITRTGGGFE